jgi:hypothetical protein
MVAITGDDLALKITTGHLNDLEPRQPFACGGAERLHDLPGHEVRAADVAHLAGADQIVQSARRLLDQRYRIDAMDLIEIDVIRAELIKNARLVAPASRGTSFRPARMCGNGSGNRNPADAALRDTSHALHRHATGVAPKHYWAAGSFTGMARIAGPAFLLNSELNGYRNGQSSTQATSPTCTSETGPSNPPCTVSILAESPEMVIRSSVPIVSPST